MQRLSRSRWTALSLVTAAAAAADQLTKLLAIHALQLDTAETLLGFIKLGRIENAGVAYNLLAGQLSVIVLVTCLVLGWLLVYFARTPHRQRLLPVALGLILGGAVSNLAERIVRGYVTDYVRLPFTQTFNLADLCLVAGVVLLAVVLQRRR